VPASKVAPVVNADDLVERINVEHAAVERSGSEMLERAVSCGELLAEAKQSMAHGDWTAWLRANFAGSIRTAQVYMRLAKAQRAALLDPSASVRHALAGIALHGEGKPAKNGKPQFETVPIADLKPNPRNGRHHPEEQLEHLAESIREHGFFQNVVAADDGTILAGHGRVEAARLAGLSEVPVARLPLAPDDPKALKILAGDNEVGLTAEDDERKVADLLKEVSDSGGLLGTGHDAQTLANLALVTRPESEIADFDAAAHWAAAGMPTYDPPPARPKVIVTFRNDADRDEFLTMVGSEVVNRARQTVSIWWPNKPRGEHEPVEFVEEAS
jgi:hypothetical protein